MPTNPVGFSNQIVTVVITRPALLFRPQFASFTFLYVRRPKSTVAANAIESS